MQQMANERDGLRRRQNLHDLDWSKIMRRIIGRGRGAVVILERIAEREGGLLYKDETRLTADESNGVISSTLVPACLLQGCEARFGANALANVNAR